ncbi:MAG: tetratricopeptide repeat protein [Magnetococcales bacterium]|nr:tetratricopeptide repeat protein [Magnetococcales bacterium]
MNKHLTNDNNLNHQITVSEAYSLATDHLIAQRYEEAFKLCSTILLTTPNHIEAINLLGVIAQKIGRHDIAAEHFQQAININSKISKLHFNLATSLLPLGQKEEAILSYTKAISLEPSLPEFHYNLANVHKELKRFKEAIASYKKAISINPIYIDAHFHLGSSLIEDEQFDEAVKCFKKLLTIKPDFPEATHLLNALTGNTSETAPREYVKGVFNSYADNFESHLINTLKYKTPSLIKDAVVKHVGDKKNFKSVLDIGCGTGLMGVEVRDIAEKLIGIDLSENMISLAKKKSVYDDLYVDDIIDRMQSLNSNFELILASDVFVYIGDLEPIFRCINKYSTKETIFAFSTEHTDDDGFIIQNTGRYAHSKSYIFTLAEKLGLKIEYFTKTKLRKHKSANNWLIGGIYILTTYR